MRTPPLVLLLLLSACSSGAGTTALPTSTLPVPATTLPGGTVSPTAPAVTTTPLRSTPTPGRTASPAPRRTAAATASVKATASPTRAPKTFALDMVSQNRFSPDVLTLRSGDSVLVTNRDRAPHDFTIAELGVESGTMHQGDTFPYPFGPIGTFTFVCTIHQGMEGTLRVTR